MRRPPSSYQPASVADGDEKDRWKERGSSAASQPGSTPGSDTMGKKKAARSPLSVRSSAQLTLADFSEGDIVELATGETCVITWKRSSKGDCYTHLSGSLEHAETHAAFSSTETVILPLSTVVREYYFRKGKEI